MRLLLFAKRIRNLITNTGEVNATGFISSGGNTTASSTEQAHTGSASLKCTYGATGTGCAVWSVTLPKVRRWTYEAWVYIPSTFDGGGIRAEPTGFVGVSLGTTANRDANMSLRDQWQMISQAFTPAPSDVIGDVRITRTGAAPSASGVIYVDDLRLY